MKSMLIIASFIALAVASPAHRGLVMPGAAGPAVAPENIAGGPVIVDFQPVAVGPAPAPIIVADEAENTATPFVQIILNINGATHVIDAPVAAPTPIEMPVAAPAPAPILVPEAAPAPVQVVEVVPAEIGAPVLPTPVVPGPAEIGTPILPSPVVPGPAEIGTPVLPSPAVVLPEALN